MARAKEFKRLGVDAVFVEALPDRESMRKCVEEIGIPTFANSKQSPWDGFRDCSNCSSISREFSLFFFSFQPEKVSNANCFAVIEGGQTENLSAKDLAELGFCAVAYPWTLVAAKLRSIRETLEDLKKSMTVGAPPMILSYSEVCEGVGFNKYWVSPPFPVLTYSSIIKTDIFNRISKINIDLTSKASPTATINQ